MDGMKSGDRPIVVVGGGGHAKVAIGVLKKSGYCVIGYTDHRDHGNILTVPRLGEDDILTDLIRREGRCSAVVGVGKVDTSDRRARLQADLTALGYECPAIISVTAIVNEDVSLGAGTMVLDGVVINSGTRIGMTCIINTHSTVEHDCTIGHDVHIAPGATISGGVRIGDHCMIGAGATIVQGVDVCDGCMVGAGATVVSDLSVAGTYVGTPAKRLEHRA